MSFSTRARAATFVGMISIAKALEIMHSGAAFSCKVVTYDRRRKDKSGRVMDFGEAKLVWAENESPKEPRGVRPLTQLEKDLTDIQERVRRRPRHGHWYTRNIRQYINGLPTQDIRKIHPALIIEFNGEKTCA